MPGLRLKSFSVLIFLCALICRNSVAQLSDDFSDGDFTSGPSWEGTDSAFRVNENFELQLSASAPGTAWLSTVVSTGGSENSEWEFYVKQSFSPSGANFGRFYLMSDQADLSGPLNGYYLQFGETGSGDAVELFRQSGAMSTSVCRASAARIAASFALRMKVSRSADGFWQLEIDYSGDSNFAAEASGADMTHTASRYSGILCQYTITNATRFYFDDIFIRSAPAPDRLPPGILSLQTTSPRSVQLVFSEKLDAASARTTAHYSISPAASHPVTASLHDDGRTVDLFFSDEFRNGYYETLTVERVADSSLNAMPATALEFLYFVPASTAFRDVIITEVLADPGPAVRLPEAEFLELYNRSHNPIDLSAWLIADEATSAPLGHYILLPGEYLILTSSSHADKFTPHGGVLPVSGFPVLNNAGEAITLKDSNGATIDSLKYDLSWYADDEKADGGWSLELIDPENICADKANWTAADAEAGGTPGAQNSVFANKPDNTGPRIISVLPSGPYLMEIAFDEKLEKVLPTIESFALSPFLPLASVQFGDATLTSFHLMAGEPIQPGTAYTLTVDGIYDCVGNRIQEAYSAVVFVLPEKGLAGDIVLNEILFNPRPTGVDFVELFNASGKTIDLKNWSLRNVGSGAGQKQKEISGTTMLFPPGTFRVLTPDANILKGEYPRGAEENFKETELPPLNDDWGSVVLIDDLGAVVDSVYYADDMHAPFVSVEDGISLERISPGVAGHQRSNWRSASSAAGFATPGYLNSNAREDTSIGDGRVRVAPEIIQRNVYPFDFTQIQYRFERGGFMANIRIFDQHGRTIRTLAENELLGTEGFFRWDGDVDNGAAAGTGYYMVWFEIFDAEGTRKIYRKRIAVY